MDDADEDRRNLIFNTLANLPKDVLVTLADSVDRLRATIIVEDYPNIEEIRDILRELIPPKVEKKRRVTKKPLDREAKLDQYWIEADGDEVMRIWEAAPEIGKRPVFDAEGDDIAGLDGWWHSLTLVQKEMVLGHAGIDPDVVEFGEAETKLNLDEKLRVLRAAGIDPDEV